MYDRIGIKEVIIESGESDSDLITLGGATPVGISFPANWATVDLSFAVRPTTGDPDKTMVNASNATYSFSSVAADTYLPLDPSLWAGIEHFKLLGSGNQTGRVHVKIHLRAVS